MALIGSLLIHLKAQTSDFTQKMTQARANVHKFQFNVKGLGSTMKATNDSFARMGKLALGGFAGYLGVRSIVNFGKDILGLAMRAEEADNLFAVSFGGMAKSVRTWSETLAKKLGLSAYALRENSAMFMAMFKSFGFGEEQAAGLSTSLTSLADDMASFYNLDIQDAIEKLQAGITGETEPLKRLGIVINETRVKQMAMEQGWLDNKKTLSETEKVMARYGLIMQQTADAQGDLFRTQNSTTNLLRRFQATWTATKIAMGKAFLPAATESLKGLTKLLMDNKDAIVAWAQGLGDLATQLATWFSTVAVPKITEFASAITDKMVPSLQSLAENLERVAKAAERTWAFLSFTPKMLYKAASSLPAEHFPQTLQPIVRGIQAYQDVSDPSASKRRQKLPNAVGDALIGAPLRDAAAAAGGRDVVLANAFRSANQPLLAALYEILAQLRSQRKPVGAIG